MEERRKMAEEVNHDECDQGSEALEKQLKYHECYMGFLLQCIRFLTLQLAAGDERECAKLISQPLYDTEARLRDHSNELQDGCECLNNDRVSQALTKIQELSKEIVNFSNFAESMYMGMAEEEKEETALYRLQNNNSWCPVLYPLGIVCSDFWNLSFEKAPTKEDFRTHMNRQPKPTPHISVHERAERVVNMIKGPNGMYHDGLVFIIDKDILLRQNICLNRSNYILEGFNLPKSWYAEGEGVRFVTESHWLVNYWIPERAILGSVPIARFLEVTQEHGIFYDEKTKKVPHLQYRPPIPLEAWRLLFHHPNIQDRSSDRIPISLTSSPTISQALSIRRPEVRPARRSSLVGTRASLPSESIKEESTGETTGLDLTTSSSNNDRKCPARSSVRRLADSSGAGIGTESELEQKLANMQLDAEIDPSLSLDVSN
ncbi:hypothetical protein DL98DRAFT_632963 [Cadophora sp. DSE1049]|nr:hypothetical protein DL98DRAFT_632963 [Cadophora sp. DSE1049]